MNPGERVRDPQQQQRLTRLDSAPTAQMPNVDIDGYQDWDFAISQPTPRLAGEISVSLEFQGRSQPDPIEWETTPE